MANTINNIKDAAGIIAKGAARMLEDEMHFVKSIDKADKKDFDGKNGYKAGDTIQISKPPRFTADTAFDITSSIQDIVEEKQSLALDTISTVGVELDTSEMATEMGLKSLMKRVIKPAIQTIGQDVENRFMAAAAQATYQSVGTAGSTVFDTDTILQAREKMNKQLCPKDNMRMFQFDSTAGRSAVNARKGLFQSSAEISKQYKQGLVGLSDGFIWKENELLHTHTNGTDVTGIAVEATVLAPAEGASSIGVDGLTTTTGTMTKGTVFTIAGVYDVHPITKVAYTHLKQFTVTATATADGSGNATVSISPSIYAASNGLQNVDALHADEAAVTIVGSASTAYKQNLAYHKEAFRCVSVPLVMPVNAEFAEQSTYNGITVAIVRDFDVLKRRMVTRLDFLGGIAPVRQEWACRITD